MSVGPIKFFEASDKPFQAFQGCIVQVLVMEQIDSDRQDRIIDVAVLVAGRLVTANRPHEDKAMLTALCQDDVKRGQLQHWLTQSGCPDKPEDYAAHFDRLYHIRYGECFVCLVPLAAAI